MKLMIKKEFFDLIKAGLKRIEYRDAHITYICEETKEELVREVVMAVVHDKVSLPKDIRDRDDLFSD